MTGTGRLALWHDCAEGHQGAFEAWYRDEHLPERLAIPGFQRGRRFEAVSGPPRFFTCYETSTPEVLTSPAYLARLDAPTPRTSHIMTEVMQNLNRTLCRVQESVGHLRGGWAITLAGGVEVDIGALASEPGIARAEIWRAIETVCPQSTEETLRGGDASIKGCLIVETLREADCTRLAARLPGARIWRLMCEMVAEDAS